MTVPRNLIVDRSVVGCYHCVSRCVRRTFLCGGEFEHRKDWIRERLQHLVTVFTIDVAAYAIMSNHMHVVVRIDPHLAADMPALEVAERWSRLFPASIRRWAGTRDIDAAIGIVAADPQRIAVLRDRLSDLSWFMKCAKEPIARRANREDDCTGCFWEGRFQSPRLLDDASVLKGMVYADLNPVRAGVAPTPEQSDHTSIQDRIRVRQLFGERRRRGKRVSKRAQHRRMDSVNLTTAEDGIWLAPVDRERNKKRSGLLPLTLDQYLTVVDQTGRAIRSGKRGVLPPTLRPILERLKVETSAWIATWDKVGRIVGTAIGNPESCALEAKRRGVKRVFGSLGRPSLST
ncbi:MAG: hypothetical protein HKO59_06730 [Phycisphaerales bacterium]|nr:hypothetical protein [Phycisphaerae bacterium]NNF41730.1 hypothetical protein [Phycisphaerales bacterium]NNM25670.1 hypothetical protein [Phycisphaerales bacterium]